MLFLCAAYVFGCAFRSFLPRADVQRICLFDTRLSSVLLGRSVATVAEICFAAQWAIVLHTLRHDDGSRDDVERGVVGHTADSDRGMLLMVCGGDHQLFGQRHRNSTWAVAFFAVAVGFTRLLPEFDGAVRAVLVIAIVGIAGYLAFLLTVDVPMYLARWRANVSAGGALLRPLEGLRDITTRWVVTHEVSEWKEE